MQALVLVAMSKLVRTPLLAALSFALLTPGIVAAQGILLLAHGGRDDWNRKVLEVASQVDAPRPVEVAFGMANKRAIQDTVDRLAELGVTRIVAVPLFISSHSSVFRTTVPARNPRRCAAATNACPSGC